MSGCSGSLQYIVNCCKLNLYTPLETTEMKKKSWLWGLGLLPGYRMLNEMIEKHSSVFLPISGNDWTFAYVEIGMLAMIEQHSGKAWGW